MLGWPAAPVGNDRRYPSQSNQRQPYRCGVVRRFTFWGMLHDGWRLGAIFI